MIAQAEAPQYLAASNILLSPHVRNEDGTPFFGSPTKLFEYMAMGKAVVASDLDQIGEVTCALLDTAKDGANRNQPQAAKVAGELSGLIQKGGTSVHVGHNYTEVNILDQSQHAYMDGTDPSERRDKRAALRKGLGLE